LIKNHNAVLLRQRGSLTVGRDLEEALAHLERIEKAAEIFFYAKLLGKVNHIPPDATERLRAIRERYLKGL
jgi:ribulose-5-phosphate 4-epimerase/fuculose-1-phosphate aldolase